MTLYRWSMFDFLHFRTLLLKLVEKGLTSKHPQLMLRRTESIVEKMLTNWLVSFHHDHHCHEDHDHHDNHHHHSIIVPRLVDVDKRKSKSWNLIFLLVTSLSEHSVCLPWENLFTEKVRTFPWNCYKLVNGHIKNSLNHHDDHDLFAGALLVRLHEGLRWLLPVCPFQSHQVPGHPFSRFSKNDLIILILKFTFATFPFGEISIFRLSWLLCKSIYNSTNWKLSDPRLTPLYQICRLANQRVGVFSMEGNIVLGEYIDHGGEEIWAGKT